MKRLALIIALVLSAATLVKAANVTDTGPGAAGDVLYYTGPAGNDQGTWSSLPTLVQQIVNNNTVVPATIGTSLNSGAVSTVGNLDITGSGITQTVTGSGASGTSSYDFSNLSTVEGQTNATNITNVSNSLATTNSNVTTLSNTVTNNSTDISGLQTTVANHTTQINQNTAGIAAINNMSDPSTVLNQTVSNNTAAIANETTRATGVESGIQNLSDGSLLSNTVNTHTAQIGTLQTGLNTTNTNVSNLSAKESNDVSALNTGLTNETNRATGAENTLQSNINSEAATRAAGDAALQSQINNVNAQAQDNTNRIDRLEQTKYLLEPTVRLYDDKHIQVQAFDSYDVRHGSNFAAGLRLMYKIGPSYEEKLLKKTNPEIARLLASTVTHDVIERDAIKKQLAEDRALITEQAALLKQLSARNDNVVLATQVSKTSSTKVLPVNDEDLLQALDKNNEAFAASK
jgi:hypothetical protein